MSEHIDIYIDTTTRVPEDATEFDYELFERFMSGGPWVAHSEYMKLKEDNAKLRNDADLLRAMLSQVQTKLREYLSRIAKTAESLEAENERLRKLCADLRFCRRNNCLTCSHGRFCDMHFDERYAELGVEMAE